MIGATRYVAKQEIARHSALAGEIAKLQASISTGKKIALASDDPLAAGRVAEIRQMQADQSAWTRNAATGAAIAAAADDRLGSVQSILDRAKELVLAGRTDSSAPADRQAMALELRGLADDIGTIMQTRDPTGRMLFPGDAPLAIPVSEAISLTATDTRAHIFEGVAVTGGPKTIADILNDAADALELTDPLLRGTAATASIAEVDVAVGHVTAIRADQGVRAQRFAETAMRLAGMDDRLAEERSALEDTDLTYALSAFQAKKLALEAAQTLYAKAHASTLFDRIG